MPSELIDNADLDFIVMDDDLKEYMVDFIDHDIRRRFGPHFDMGQNEFWSWTRFYGRETTALLKCPFRVQSIVKIQESDAGGTLADVDGSYYELVSDHRIYRTTGTWNTVGTVTYIPFNDDDLRLGILIRALRLLSVDNGADDVTMDGYTISNPDLRAKYENIMASYRPWPSV